MKSIRIASCCLIATFGVLGSRSVAAQTPTRDAAKPPAVGTASITGAIVSDDADARPLRRVRVGVMTSDRQVSRTVVTDDEGRFNFVALPAGRYMLTANKQGYVSHVLRSTAAEPSRYCVGPRRRPAHYRTDATHDPRQRSLRCARRPQWRTVLWRERQRDAEPVCGHWPANAPSGSKRGVGRPRAIPTVGTCRRRLRDLGERGVRFADSGH